MDGDLYRRDFYGWTQRQAAALRRLAERRANLDAELDLLHLIEEVEDLGSGQVSKVRSHLEQLLKHLVLVASAPSDPAVNHWRGELVTFQGGAADPYRPSMRREVEARLDRDWRRARRAAEAKLGRALPHLPEACPFALDELLDEDAPLEPLVARLKTPDAAAGA